MDSLIFASAVTLAAKLRSGAVTAQAVVEAHLTRIAQVNPQLNAIVQLTAEAALAEAAAADIELARGQVRGAAPWGPLHDQRLD